MKRNYGMGLLLLSGLALAVLGWGCSNDEMVSVVFDIDGTLTPYPIEYWSARPDAPAAVQAFVDKGYAVVYLTARPQIVDALLQTERFLKNSGFPNCPVFLSEDILIGDEAVVNYKVDTLDMLTATMNRKFVFGYGDSTTDFDAYNEAGIPVSGTFALLRCIHPYNRCDKACEPGNYAQCLTNGYQDQMPFIEAQPVVNEGLNTWCTGW